MTLRLMVKALHFGTDFYQQRRKEINVLFNDALNTFYLQLYSVKHMVKNHSDCEGGNPAAANTWDTLTC